MNTFNPYNTLNPLNPIIKNYNVEVNTLTGNLNKVADLYEDILPSYNAIRNIKQTTIAERLILYNNIRGLYVLRNDGEEINFDNKSDIKNELFTLLSYIKILQVNPYHYSKLTNNPYTTLSDNIIIWNAKYPVQLNTQTN